MTNGEMGTICTKFRLYLSEKMSGALNHSMSSTPLKAKKSRGSMAFQKSPGWYKP